MKKIIVLTIVLFLFSGCMYMTSRKTVPSETNTPDTESESLPETIDTKSAETIRAEFIAECEDLSHESILRFPADYRGKKVRVTGTVLQALNADNEGTTYVNLRIEDADGNEWFAIFPKSNVQTPNGNILDGDRLTVYGLSAETFSFSTPAGIGRTLPAIAVAYIDAAPEE